MSAEQPFLDAIERDPSDADLLIYADWLEEQGDDFAAKVREVVKYDKAERVYQFQCRRYLRRRESKPRSKPIIGLSLDFVPDRLTRDRYQFIDAWSGGEVIIRPLARLAAIRNFGIDIPPEPPQAKDPIIRRFCNRIRSQTAPVRPLRTAASKRARAARRGRK